jgi:penicillin-binding protein A
MMFAGPAPRGSVRWLEPVHRRRRRPPLPLVPLGVLLLLVAAGVGAYVVLHARSEDQARRREVAQRFVAAWERGDTRAMWRLLSARSRRENPLPAFVGDYRAADRAATVREVRAGRIGEPSGGRARVPVAVRTRLFGTLRGTVALPVVVEGDQGRVDWSPALRLPGLRAGEEVRRRLLERPRRRSVLAPDGSRLADHPASAAIAGSPAAGDAPATGLEALYDERLAGRAGAELSFGERLVRRVRARRGKPVRATIRPALQQTALNALGGRLGGVAVVRPRDGAVLALAGLAVSAPQPPGSTFKVITLAAALQAGIATPSSTFPVRTQAVLSGVPLRNASDESCGGSLTAAFAISCNSVFAPLGAKLGAKRLVRFAEAFGFNETPKVPAAKPSTISKAKDLKDDLAVGAAAIGQERDLATPLEMATVAATIGAHGRRARPRIAKHERVVRRRVVRRAVAAQVRTMMLAVVRGGTGTAAAVPGVEVAGKTGTAELRPTADATPDPANTDAWFVAFAPASAPKVAVGVMLVGAGAGGAAAAPIARQVLAAAL